MIWHCSDHNLKSNVMAPNKRRSEYLNMVSQMAWPHQSLDFNSTDSFGDVEIYVLTLDKLMEMMPVCMHALSTSDSFKTQKSLILRPGGGSVEVQKCFKFSGTNSKDHTLMF